MMTMKDLKLMSRTELVAEIISAVGAETDEQIESVNAHLTDIIIAVELRHGTELLIEDETDDEIAIIKAECIRRYRYD